MIQTTHLKRVLETTQVIPDSSAILAVTHQVNHKVSTIQATMGTVAVTAVAETTAPQVVRSLAALVA